MTLLAHRGLTAQARDNSAEALTAVADAVAKGVELGIEMDIRAIADTFVLNHDPFEGGIPLFDAHLPALRQQLQKNCPIELTAGLAILKDVPVVLLELKEAGRTEDVIHLVMRHHEATGQPLSAFLFLSFIPRVVAEVKQIDSRLTTGMLIEGNLSSSRPTPDRVCLTLDDPPTEEGISVAETMWKVADHVDADMLCPHWTRLNRRVLEVARERKKQIVPWSVNNAHLLASLAPRDEVAHVVTDFPEMVFPAIKAAAAHRKLIPLSESE